MWQSIVAIMIAGLITQNIVLVQSWGICPFLGVSKKTNSALGMGLAVTFVLAITGALIFPIYEYLIKPNGLDYLNIVLFILIVASVVQMLEVVIKRFSPTLYNSLGIYLPLITTNCAVLGTINANVAKSYSFLEAFTNSVFIGLGFTLALILMAGIRERLEKNKVAKSLRGFPIALITAALMAMAFAGLSGFNLF